MNGYTAGHNAYSQAMKNRSYSVISHHLQFSSELFQPGRIIHKLLLVNVKKDIRLGLNVFCSFIGELYLPAMLVKTAFSAQISAQEKKFCLNSAWYS